MFPEIDGTYYAMKDDGTTAPFPIGEAEAKRLNQLQYGIFWRVNGFKGDRKIENLERIYSWFIEIDGNKDEQLLKIQNAPLYPSQVIESKNGYHIYYYAKEATFTRFKEIQDALCYHFDGDPKAKDVTRILRAPDFLHWKDEASPFMVRKHWHLPVRYTEKDMLHFFPTVEEETSGTRTAKKIIITEGEDFTTKLNSLDNMAALQHFSGSAFVNHEVYEFVPTSNGRFNIKVNGKATSCFIDEKKRIGAIPGGPTIFSWLRYFNHTDKQICRILREELGL